LPYFYQRIIIRIVQPVLLSGLTLMWYFAVKNPILIAVIVAVMLIIIFVLYIRYKNRVNISKMAKIAPLHGNGDSSGTSSRDRGSRNGSESKTAEMIAIGAAGNTLNSPAAVKSNKQQYSSADSSSQDAERVMPSAAPKTLNVLKEEDEESSNFSSISDM